MCYGLAHNTMTALTDLSSILIHSSFDCFCYCLKHVSIGRNTYTTHSVNETHAMTLEECLAISPCGDDISTSGSPSKYSCMCIPWILNKENESTINSYMSPPFCGFVHKYVAVSFTAPSNPSAKVIHTGVGCKVLMPTTWHTFWDSVITISTILQHTHAHNRGSSFSFNMLVDWCPTLRNTLTGVTIVAGSLESMP